MSNIIIVTIGGANASDELDTDRHSNADDMDNHAVTDDRDTLIVHTAIISFDKYTNVNQPDLRLCPLFFPIYFNDLSISRYIRQFISKPARLAY